MLHPYPFSVSIFRSLFQRDLEIARKARLSGCPHCGGPLHCAYYQRHPPNGPVTIPRRFCIRFSLCCGREGCRRRFLPPSCLFMGRRLHSRAVILVVLAARRERSKQQVTVEKLEELYSVPVRTIVRWTAFFRTEFVRCSEWRCIQGLVSAAVSRDDLPGSLLEHFLAQHDDVDEGLVACASFMAFGTVNV